MVFRREGKGKGEAGIAGVASTAYVWLRITYPTIFRLASYEAKRIALPRRVQWLLFLLRSVRR